MFYIFPYGNLTMIINILNSVIGAFCDLTTTEEI